MRSAMAPRFATPSPAPASSETFAPSMQVTPMALFWRAYTLDASGGHLQWSPKEGGRKHGPGAARGRLGSGLSSPHKARNWTRVGAIRHYLLRRGRMLKPRAGRKNLRTSSSGPEHPRCVRPTRARLWACSRPHATDDQQHFSKRPPMCPKLHMLPSCFFARPSCGARARGCVAMLLADHKLNSA